MVFYRWWKPEVDIDVKFGTSGDQFYWWRKPKEPEKTTDLSQVTDKLYHIIRIRKSKDRQHNGQKKKDKQRSTKHCAEN